jgi:hypothetical protein
MTPEYQRVPATEAELAAYRRKYGERPPSVYRVRCTICGLRFWGSGMGIGSHRRSARHNAAEQAAYLARIVR